MQHLPQGFREEEGCFVYQVVGGDIDVRSQTSVGDECRTERIFAAGDMVAVDRVRPSRHPNSKNGPFLRLSDASGWLFEKKYGGEALMKRIPVKKGLWCFYVDNGSTGMALRRHPVDRLDMKADPEVMYQPMQKIHCDVKVQHPDTGVHFYRVQGTDGWVFDRRPASEPGDDDTFMLLEESMVKKGLFVYECVPSRTISIRKEPNVGRGSNATDRDVNEGTLVAVDAIRQSPFNHGNGPFLRLTDGSGWLFEFKHGERLMGKVSVWEGKWQLKVLNSPSGIGLRRQPIDCQNFMDGGIAYEPGSIVTCSHMVQASSGVKFYRVQGTDGWIFDQRNGQSMLTLVSTSHPDLDFSPSKSNNGNKSCWSPDFVRGIAAAVEGVHEIAFNENSRVISFRTADHARINVYYTTRTIGTALSHPAQGATQLFRRNCSTEELLEILKNPRFHTAKGYKRKRGDNYSSQEQLLVRTEYGQSVMADQEDEARNVLLDVDEEMEKLLQKKNRLLTKIRDVDLERAAEASVISEKVAARRREQDERKEQAERRQQAKHQLQQRTCDICHRVFPNEHSKQQHYNAVHVFRCNICWKSFSDQHSLYQHQDALGHL